MLALIAISENAGPAAAFLAVVPVVHAALAWGKRASIPLAIAWASGNPFVLGVFTGPGERGVFDFAIAGATLLALGIIAGHNRDQRKKLESQVKRRAIAESDMRDAAQELERRSFELAGLVDLALMTRETPTIRGRWDRIASEIKRLLDPDLTVIYEVYESRGEIIPAHASGRSAESVSMGASYSLSSVPFKSLVDNPHGQIVGGIAFRNLKQSCEGDELDAFKWAGSVIAMPVYWRSEQVALLLLGGRQEMRRVEIMDTVYRVAVVLAGAVGASRLYEEALELATELEELNRHKDNFMSVVSHELKTPLTSVLAFSQIMLRNADGSLGQRQLQQLKAVERGGERLKLLIDDLLDASAIWNGKFKIEPEPCDLAELVRTACADFMPMAETRDQWVLIEIPETAVTVSADHGRMAQVVVNLLSNASKYSPEGSNISVRLEQDSESGNALLHVTDQGIGISEQDRERLFGWFFRADNPETRAVAGTGIGLFISNTIARNLGGQIGVTSEPGRGSTFTVTLPLLEEGKAETAA
jgi:signal transduction histidine kinase